MLRCPSCGITYTDYHLLCDRGCDSLLKSEYHDRLVLKDLPGGWRFMDWLPCSGPILTGSGPLCYRSEGLASELGLENLFISFSGYWPERKVMNPTGSFKDMEAPVVMAWAREMGIDGLVTASAGNTARAIAHVANLTGARLHLVVPRSAAPGLWTPSRPSGSVEVTVMDGDYAEAIEAAFRISKEQGLTPEGGARNAARRDGLATVFLNSAMTMGRLPDHLFQAVSSSAGIIGSWEAAVRLRRDGFAGPLPRLHLSQNERFCPIVKAWRAGERRLKIENVPEDLYAQVLSDKRPPYVPVGGLFDALTECGGEVYAVPADRAEEARRSFERTEGVDIMAPPGVAVASLRMAVENGRVRKNEHILINITGGGMELLERDMEKYPLT